MDESPVIRPICFCASCVANRDCTLSRLSFEARSMMWTILLAAQGFADANGEAVTFLHILEAIDYVEHKVHDDFVNGFDNGEGRYALDLLDRELAVIIP